MCFLLQADILVGTAGQDLNLSNNPCARALSEAAGQCLQQQCTNNGPVAEGDITLLSQTGNLNCRAVIFAVCSHWNDGRGKEVSSLTISVTILLGVAVFT